VELSEHDTDEVIEAVQNWILKMDPSDESDAHHLLEALWVHQQFNVENRDLLALVMSSPNPHARIAGRNVQIMWDADLYTPETTLITAEASAEPSSPDGRPTPPEDAIVIRTVTEEMRYDTPSFQVKPGQEVAIWFENADYMPHNLVVGEPGSFEEIGAAADALGADGFEVQFIPENDRILAFTDLIEYEGWQVLTFTAPEALGVYDVLCTFPGHRHSMNAKMWVIE